MSKLIFFPRYTNKAPSSRYRFYNYVDYYKSICNQIKIYPLFDDFYLDNKWNHTNSLYNVFRVFKAYIYRIYTILTLKNNSNIVYIGSDLLPYFPYGIEKILKFKKIPYIVEYDDAIFHNYDYSHHRIIRLLLRNKIKSVIKGASHIITGSSYLTNYCKQYNYNVTQIPTSIDRRLYSNIHPRIEDKFIIGWIGSSSSSEYLSIVADALRDIGQSINYELRLIGFDKFHESILHDINYRIVTWNEETEVQEMANFSIGIMPLPDTPFSRGKCAFKLVQYMAIGIPTISTPLQSNVDIDNKIGNLFASSKEEWILSIRQIYENYPYYKNIGIKNKEYALANYTIQNNYPKYLNIFNSLLLIQ